MLIGLCWQGTGPWQLILRWVISRLVLCGIFVVVVLDRNLTCVRLKHCKHLEPPTRFSVLTLDYCRVIPEVHTSFLLARGRRYGGDGWFLG